MYRQKVPPFKYQHGFSLEPVYFYSGFEVSWCNGGTINVGVAPWGMVFSVTQPIIKVNRLVHQWFAYLSRVFSQHFVCCRTFPYMSLYDRTTTYKFAIILVFQCLWRCKNFSCARLTSDQARVDIFMKSGTYPIDHRAVRRYLLAVWENPQRICPKGRSESILCSGQSPWWGNLLLHAGVYGWDWTAAASFCWERRGTAAAGEDPRSFSNFANFNSGIVIFTLSSWGERRSAWDIMDEVQALLADLPGVLAFPVSVRGLAAQFRNPYSLSSVAAPIWSLPHGAIRYWQRLTKTIPVLPALTGIIRKQNPSCRSISTIPERQNWGSPSAVSAERLRPCSARVEWPPF